MEVLVGECEAVEMSVTENEKKKKRNKMRSEESVKEIRG